MNARTRLRAAWQILRHGTHPAAASVARHLDSIDDASRDKAWNEGYRTGIAHRDEDDAIVDQAIARFAVATATDHLAARVAVEHFPLGRPRLTLVSGGTR